MVLLYLLVKMVFSTLSISLITKMKYSTRKSVIIIIAVNTVIWLSNYAIYRVWGAVFLGNVFILTASIPVYICFLFVSKARLLKTLFSSITITIFGMPVSFAGQLVNFYTHSFLLQWAVEIAGYALLLLFIVKVFRKPYFKILDTLEKGWGLFCIAACLLISIVYLLQYYPTPVPGRPENIPVVFLVHALTFVFYLIIYLNLENISHYYNLKQDKKLMTVQMDMHKKEYNALLENINSLKIYRHDMRHYLAAIDSLLNNDNALEAQRFIRQLNGSLEKTVLEQYCENYVVNIILSAYIQKAKDEQITVMCEVAVPEDIRIDPIEIGVLFANAIDNAVHACIKLERMADRWIRIVCKEHCGQIYIRISNPYFGTIAFDGEYPVASSEEHGTGSRSIAAIAVKNDGVFSFVAENGIFTLTTTLRF